jgi:hypothetical protein
MVVADEPLGAKVNGEGVLWHGEEERLLADLARVGRAWRAALELQIGADVHGGGDLGRCVSAVSAAVVEGD